MYDTYRSRHQTCSPNSVLSSPSLPIQLFIPSVGVFTLADSVPFFLQLRGEPSSLAALFQPRVPRAFEGQDAAKNFGPPSIRVLFKRQVRASESGVSLIRSYVVGESTLRSVAPGYGNPSEHDATADYEGEVSCLPTVTTGGFNFNGQLCVTVSAPYTA